MQLMILRESIWTKGKAFSVANDMKEKKEKMEKQMRIK